MNAIDLRFSRSMNLHQRMYAIGEFIWYSSHRADSIGKVGEGRGPQRYLNNQVYICFIRDNLIVEDLL